MTMNKIIKSLFFATICMLAAPASGVREQKQAQEEENNLEKSVLGAITEVYLNEQQGNNPIKQDVDNKEQDETSSQYSPSESDITEPGDSQPDIANLRDVESEYGDDGEPTFWNIARRLVSQTVSSVYLGFVNGVTLGSPNFTKKHSMLFGLAATYGTAALCGGVKTPIELKRDSGDKRYWACAVTARQAWVTGVGFLGYLAGRVNSQKIAKLFF